jgi:hypothetical protein
VAIGWNRWGFCGEARSVADAGVLLGLALTVGDLFGWLVD